MKARDNFYRCADNLWYRNGQYVRLMRRNTNSILKSTRSLISSRLWISLLIILRWRLEQGEKGLTQKRTKGVLTIEGIREWQGAYGLEWADGLDAAAAGLRLKQIFAGQTRRGISELSHQDPRSLAVIYQSAQIHFCTNFYGLRCYNKVNQFDEHPIKLIWIFWADMML